MRRSVLSLPLVACAALLLCLLAPAFASASSAAAAAAASSASAPLPSEVVVLTDENFDELTSAGSWLLEFYGQRGNRGTAHRSSSSEAQSDAAAHSD